MKQILVIISLISSLGALAQNHEIEIVPKSFLESVFEKNEENYASEPFIAKCYYRMFLSSNNKYLKSREFIIEYYDDRKKKGATTLDYLMNIVGKRVYKVQDTLKYFNSVLMMGWYQKFKIDKKLTYTIDSSYFFENDLIYVIKEAYKGKSYERYFINSSDSGMVRYEAELVFDTTIMRSNFFYKSTNTKMSIDYQKIDGKYYPKKLTEHMINGSYLTSNNVRVPIDCYLQELYINHIITDDTFINRNLRLFDKRTNWGWITDVDSEEHYKKEFWDKYEYSINDKLYNNVIQAITKKKG